MKELGYVDQGRIAVLCRSVSAGTPIPLLRGVHVCPACGRPLDEHEQVGPAGDSRPPR